MQRYSLSEISSPDWFVNLVSASQQFGQLCEIIGAERVAMIVVAGVQIQSISVDPSRPLEGRVEFSLRDGGEPLELSVAELCLRVGDRLLERRTTRPSLPESPSPSELQEFVGIREILLAPIFDIPLHFLRVDGDSHTVEVGRDDERSEIDLETLRNRIDANIASFMSGENSIARNPSIDLGVLPDARAANVAGDWDRTIELLSPWLGGVSILLRTQQGEDLQSQVRDDVTEGLALLATALSKSDKNAEADEVLRMAVQWAGGTSLAGQIYLLLGEVCVAREAWGEAIVFLMRAVKLGADQQRAWPELAQCFVRRERPLPAAICLRQATNAGVTEDELRPLRDALPPDFLSKWKALQDFL